MEDEGLGPAGPRAPQLGAARGLDVLEQERGRDEPEQGALGQILEGVGPLASSAPATLVPDGAGSAQGPRALEPGRLLEGEVAKAPQELHCPRMAGAVQRERWCGGAPSGADEFGDSVEPFFVDIVD